MYKNILLFGMLSMLFISITIPITYGHNVKIINQLQITENHDKNNDELEETIKPRTLIQSINGPMNSPWPMYCHDTRHTGRSPYNTNNNNGFIEWKLKLHGLIWGSPIIDDDGVIYVGSWDFYAIYPNGTIKWQLDIGAFSSAATIDENGIIYIGSIWSNPNYLYAIYSNNGTVKWKYKTGNEVHGSPVIGKDGTIFFGKDESGSPPYSGYIIALYPNGTVKWKYKTNHFIYSSPAIGDDGIVYCGSHDSFLYALYPNNGTLKWKFKTGDWVGRGVSIADDGTIYFGSWDGYLYACYPDGTLKWKTGGYLAGTTPITGEDGTIYVGNKDLYALHPENGSLKWTFKLGQNEDIRDSNPCISADGTIYFGTFGGSRIYAVNKNGTEKWHKSIGGDVISAPAISKDGTVYIGDGMDDGYLLAFSYPGPNPLPPTINGPSSGKTGNSYIYTFTSVDPDNDQVSYYIEWGDGEITDWTSFQPSGEPYSESHIWTAKGTYTIRAKAKDTDGYESDWSIQTISIPRNKATNNQLLLLKLLEKFPLLQKPIQQQWFRQ